MEKDDYSTNVLLSFIQSLQLLFREENYLFLFSKKLEPKIIGILSFLKTLNNNKNYSSDEICPFIDETNSIFSE